MAQKGNSAISFSPGSNNKIYCLTEGTTILLLELYHIHFPFIPFVFINLQFPNHKNA